MLCSYTNVIMPPEEYIGTNY